MAEKILNTRILMKVDTLEAWSTSTLKLKKGELAFATVAASAGTGLEEPVVMVKIGTEEEKTFSELPWAFHAKASDVLAACKTEAGLTKFVQDVLAGEGIASDEVVGALAQRVTDAEGEIDALQAELDTAETGLKARMTAVEAKAALIGDEAVATQIQTAINALSTVYAAKSLETTVANHIADEVAHVTTADKTKWNAALQASDIAAGGANGTIAVKGADVAVKGLGSAAFTEASAYEVAGAAAAAEAAAKSYADGLAGNYDAQGSAAAAEAAAKSYADGLASNYDAAGAASAAEAAAKKYTDEEIAEWVGDKSVAAQIEELKLSENYDAKGAAAAAETAAKGHADSLNTAMNTRVEALEAIDHSHENATVLDGITAEQVAAWDAAEQNAKDYADGLDEVMDGRVAALEAKFGEGEGNVESQIEAAVAAEAKLREEADSDQVERIAALEGQVGDIDTVAGAIETAVKAEADRAKGEEARIEGLVTAEAGRAAAAEEALDERLVEVETFFKTAEDETIDQALDTLVEIQKYLDGEGAVADQMLLDIAANAKAIEDMDAAYKAADEELQGNIDTLSGTVDTKAAQADLEALDGRVDTVEEDLNAETTGLKARMTAAEGEIDALQGVVGEVTSVADYVAGEVSAAVAAEAEIARAAEKANAEDIDALEAKVATWDAAVQTVTPGTGLTATKTGTDVAIGFDDSVTFIFDCGNSAE